MGTRGTVAALQVVVIGCGALARELLALTRDLPGVKVICIDARLHMRPALIADAVAARIAETRATYGPDIRLFVAYADCGTGGALDAVIEREGVERIAGAHCYEFYAGSAAFAAMQEEELGDVLPDRLPRPPVRHHRHGRARPRPASRSCSPTTSGATAASSTSPRPTTRS